MTLLSKTMTLLCLLVCLGACGEGTSKESVNGDLVKGEKIFNQYCALCHGEDGKRALNGAKDITISVLPFSERITLVTNGKNLMTPFNGILSETEIKDVAAYSMTLKAE